MKGLLIKDFSVLFKQMRVFLLIILFFSVIPGSNMAVFAVVYAAMMPYTALAYDERSHWEQLAAAMPYRKRDLVLSKYVLGWLFTGGAALIALLGVLIGNLFFHRNDSPAVPLAAFLVGILMISITLPPMFRFGVERGRMFFVLLMVIVACGSAGLVSGLSSAPATAPLMPMVFLVLLIAAVAVTFLSIPLSIRFYGHRSR